nr:GNAT family N-acetyltransferase [Candidatus Njordarchaeota archaeon]
MKKKIRATPDICGKLRFEEEKGVKRLHFILLEYRFFEDGKEGSGLPRSLPWLLSPLSLLLHIVKSRAPVLLRLPCYFVKLERKVVGLFAAQEHIESLLVASFAVAKRFRRLGIGTCILDHIEKIARHMSKRWLEVDVLRKNIPAQRLYAEYGFAFIQSGRIRYLMRGKKPI